MIYSSILGTIGDTPIVELTRLSPKGARLFGKVEAFNPMGSVKDRLALAVIERAEQSGQLRPGQTVIEATSGNTGIGLAMVCAAKGYPLVVVMAESFSVERRRLMRFLGAKVVLTPAYLKGTGMYLKAIELAEKNGWFLTHQFENEANADVHSATTAQEILRDFKGKRLDYWVTTFGTGGTLKGVARALKKERPEIKIAVVEPENAQLLGGGVAQPPAHGEIPASHPRFQPHPIQGTSPDFISKLTADAMAEGLIDVIVPVAGAEAMAMSKALAQREGIFCGISAGATAAGAMQLAAAGSEGLSILCMLPDTGERYLSTPLFADIPADMNDEELAIMRTSPSAQFGAPPPAAPVAAAVAAPPPVDAEAKAILETAIASDKAVMFGLEWCEFTWSIRNFFERVGVPYTAVALDSVAMQKDDLGVRVRRALAEKTGINTIPQFFVGGEFVGGCTETFDAWRGGSLQEQLHALGVKADREPGLDPYSLLPTWLHKTRQAEPT